MKKRLFIIFIFFVIIFFWYSIINNYKVLLNYNYNLNLIYIIISFSLWFFYIIWSWLNWWNIVNNKNISKKEIIKIHFISWLSRYIPWKVWIVASKMIFLKKYWISKKESLVYSMYENIFQIIWAFTFCLPIILIYFLWDISQNYIYLAIFLLIALLITLYRPIFFFLINFWLKLIKKEPFKKESLLTEWQIIKYLLSYIFFVFINWLSFFFMVKWIVDIEFSYFLQISWAWVFAWVIWLLALFAPSGLWVREWILVLLLQTIFPLEVAILISVFSRLWISIIDWLIWLYILWSKYIQKRD